MGLPAINAFWIGPQLGAIHAACLESFLTVGHRVVLHAYGTGPSDVPAGVALADAEKILPSSRVVRHAQTGSLALASDLARLEIQALGLGIYVDCDCYCVRPVEDDDCLFGLQDDGLINGAVLKLPSASPLLADMRAIPSMRGFVPPWEPARRRNRYRLRAAIGLPVPLEKLPWGVLGPLALSHYTAKHGLSGRAKAQDVFYPIGYRAAGLLRLSGTRMEEFITPRTQVVHLWNEALRHFSEEPEPGSPLHRLVKTGHLL